MIPRNFRIQTEPSYFLKRARVCCIRDMLEPINVMAENLKRQIAATEEELSKLKQQLASIEAKVEASSSTTGDENNAASKTKWPLSADEYLRYGRQMIVPSIGIQGQKRLHETAILLVGAGGLGCPAAAYLAGAGFKTLGLVDGDTVDISNLHRQILHNTATTGLWKVDSAISNLRKLNPNVNYQAHKEHLTPENAPSIVSQYDIVVDCTDRPSSRYLISDICVLLQKPLVSASALKTEGQLIVLNYPAQPQGSETGGPCYRCIFPKPPPAGQVVSCGDGGILGPVVGVMGVLQALEAIKLVVDGLKENASYDAKPSMLLFSANRNSPAQFRTIRMRPKRADCFACSSKSSLRLKTLTSGSLDYVAFCGAATPVKLLAPEEQISAKEYAHLSSQKTTHVLLDVRDKTQFAICHIEGSINVPFSAFQGSKDKPESLLPNDLPKDAPIYVLCRMGNDSQTIVKKMKDSGLTKNGRQILDIKGGLRAWREEVDSTWPEY